MGNNDFGPFSFKISSGERVAILGPSGAGKTTLLQLLSNDLCPYSGVYKYKGSAIHTWSAYDLSRTRAVLPQFTNVAFGLSAQLVIGMGRIAITSDAKLPEIIKHAARSTCCDHLLDRSVDTLSGGERARVHLARVFAQLWDERNGLILVDEPLASLDPGLQIELLEGMRQYAFDRNHAIVAILHDINQAMQNFDRLILMKNAKVINDQLSGINAIEPLAQLYGIGLDLVNVDGMPPLVFPRARTK